MAATNDRTVTVFGGTGFFPTTNRRTAAGSVRRSEGSIERKLQNISAVLDLLGVQWINGYKPLAHYQDALVSAVERSLGREQGFLYPASPEVQPAEPGEDGILIPPPPPQLQSCFRTLVA
jgi:hypothetical protein